MLLGSVLAGLAGLAFDQLTVSISPEYFTLGKGLPGDDLRLRAAWLGFRSALPIGALLAGLGLVRAHGWSSWLRPILLALLVALPLGALAMYALDPFDVREAASGSMTRAASDRYLVAWGLHAGAYAGFTIGLALSLLRARSAPATTEAPPGRRESRPRR